MGIIDDVVAVGGGALFGSKKTLKNTKYIRVVEDSIVPTPLSEAIITSIFTGSDITDELKGASLRNPIWNFERAYRYGADPLGYNSYGLPNGRVFINDSRVYFDTETGVDIKAIIDAETSKDTTIEYVEYSPLSNTHVGWKWVTDNSYNAATNEIEDLSVTVGFPCYLNSIVRLYSVYDPNEVYDGAWREWDETSLGGNTPTYNDYMREITGRRSARNFPAGEVTINEGVKITYVYEDAVGALQSGSHIIDLSAYNLEDSFFHVKYSYVESTVTHYRYWFYKQGLGTYPQLDDLYDTRFFNTGTYFPYVPLRRNYVNAVDRDYGQGFQDQMKKMCRLYGTDYQELTDNINANANLDELKNVTLLMGVPINSQNPVEIKYLFKYFLRLQTLLPSVQDLAVASGNSGNEFVDTLVRVMNQTQTLNLKTVPANRFAISIEDGGTSLHLRFGNVVRNTVVRAGTTGEYTLETFKTTITREDKEQVGDPVDGNFNLVVNNKEIPVIAIRYQLSPTLCDEILVVNPSMAGFTAEDTEQAIFDSDQFLIPVDYSIATEFPVIEKTELYHRALHLVFTASVTYEIEWYETEAFQSFMKKFGIAVMITLTVASFGSGSGLGASLLAAIEAGWSATVILLIKITLTILATNYIIKFAAKELSPEALAALSIALAFAAVAAATGGFGLTDPSAFWAESLLMLSANMSVAQTMAIQSELEEIQKEALTFTERNNEKWESLEDAQSLLEVDSLLDPLLLLERREPMIIMGEAPSSFFDRTVHTGNIGTVSYDLIENFVDISLTLPDIEQTLGELK